MWKIIEFFKKLFSKKEVLLINEPKEKLNKTKSNTIEELSKEYKILKLQKAYEKGIIDKNDLTYEEKDDLINTYKKQIETLEINIDIKKKELLRYKEQIIEQKNKRNK